jgi:serine/threonine protein kinase
VYEVIHPGPTVAIAMELVAGTSLRHHCGTAQPVQKLALWGRQIAYALAEAHARGIVHRDIKPENLMLRPDGYVKVLDFGLARRAGVDRADDELALGTLGYMSPEEIEQRPITAASDIFSLGVVLYELASGTNPFRSESPDATTRMILGVAPPPLPERVGTASCARCSTSRQRSAPPLWKSRCNWKQSPYREFGGAVLPGLPLRLPSV